MRKEQPGSIQPLEPLQRQGFSRRLHRASVAVCCRSQNPITPVNQLNQGQPYGQS